MAKQPNARHSAIEQPTEPASALPSTEKGRDTRRRLMKAAAQLYENGYANARITDITDAAGLSAPQVQGLVTQNGLAFSPDGRTMYLSDSHPTVQTIWTLPLHDDGSVGERRLFADMKDLPGRPDGAAWPCGRGTRRVPRAGRGGAGGRVPPAAPSGSAGGPRRRPRPRRPSRG